MEDVAVIEDPAAGAVLLDPIKATLLSHLNEPASAATLAARVGLARQKVNYHLRVLEARQLVVPAEERYWGGLTERLMVASASSYVVSPAALGPIAADPSITRDRLSASYLIALASRMVAEVGGLWRRARSQNKRLATLSIDTLIRFKSPAERAAFTKEVAVAVATIAARYHDDRAPHGRAHRLVVAAYPAPSATTVEGV